MNLVYYTIENGYLSINSSIRDDIRAIHGTYLPKSSTLQFLTSELYTYVNHHSFSSVKDLKGKFGEEDYQKFGLAELYKRYLEWCKINNLDHAKTRATFKRDLEDLPILTSQQSRGRNDDGTPKKQTMWYLFVNNELTEEEE